MSENEKYFESEILEITPTKLQIQPIHDLVYAQKPTFDYQNVPLQMDIWRPKEKYGLPAVMFVTGGGFIASNRARMPQLRMRLAEAGYFVGSISYRVAPEAKFPAPLEDVKSAIRYVKAHADEMHVDAERVAVIGDSAGGYLAAFAGITSGSDEFDAGENLHVSSSVRAAVSLYGCSDLSVLADGFHDEEKRRMAKSPANVMSLMVNGSPGFGGCDGGFEGNKEAAQKANPLNYITEKSAPMLLMHGSEDSVVPPEQTDILFQALRKRGIFAKRYVVPNAEHAGEYWLQDGVLDVIQNFLDGYMKQKLREAL